MYLSVEEAKQKREEFLVLLDQEEKEQFYQDYLEKNTVFIPREFEQNHGIHCSTVFRKIPLSSDYKPDFLYLSKSSVSWNVVLVELEKPSSKYFKSSSIEFHSDFIAALQQINTWRSWISEDSNRMHLKNNILQSFIEPAYLGKNTFNFKYVLVHGRRAEFEKNTLRTSLINSQQREDFSIISYDSLAENLRRKYKLYVAVKKNKNFEIISKEFVDESIFAWINTDYLAITQEIKDDALSKSSEWHYLGIGKEGLFKIMEKVLPEIKIIKDRI